MNLLFAPPFIRQFKKLDPLLQEEAFEKVDIFKDNPKNPTLKAHKLKGRLKNLYSFSINYKTRIVFQYQNNDETVFLAIGNHDVYNQ